MAESASYVSCSFCDLNHDTTDTHCLSCGGSLAQGDQQRDSNDVLLALVTQLNTVLVTQSKRLLGTHRELNMRVAAGTFCMLWMFSCLIIVNVHSFNSTGTGGDNVVAVQSADEHEGVALEPSLQAAVEEAR